jgi:hypothetical protein
MAGDSDVEPVKAGDSIAGDSIAGDSAVADSEAPGAGES